MLVVREGVVDDVVRCVESRRARNHDSVSFAVRGLEADWPPCPPTHRVVCVATPLVAMSARRSRLLASRKRPHPPGSTTGDHDTDEPAMPVLVSRSARNVVATASGAIDDGAAYDSGEGTAMVRGLYDFGIHLSHIDGPHSAWLCHITLVPR